MISSIVEALRLPGGCALESLYLSSPLLYRCVVSVGKNRVGDHGALELLKALGANLSLSFVDIRTLQMYEGDIDSNKVDLAIMKQIDMVLQSRDQHPAPVCLDSQPQSKPGGVKRHNVHCVRIDLKDYGG